MNRYLLALAAAAVATAAAPASATINIFATPSAVQPDENVLFQNGPAVGNTATGITNQSNTQVDFTGIEDLLTSSQGQARVEAADGGLNALQFALNDPTLGFTAVEFNIFRGRGDAGSTTLNFTDQFGTVFSQIFTLGNGQNFFSALAIDNQFITNVSFTTAGDVQDVRQVRIGGIGSIDDGGTGSTVPEPATWAMMLLGFGLVGVSRRRRAVQTTRVTA